MVLLKVLHRSIFVLRAYLGLGLVLCALPAVARDALPPLPDDVAAQFPAIGRIGHSGFRTRSACTGTLVAPDLVLTAAHCVSDTGETSRVFVAGWSRGEFIAARRTIRETRHPDFAGVASNSSLNDIALMVLESPITDVRPIPLAQIPDSDLNGTSVAIIGYHSRTPHLLSGDFACPVRALRSGLLRVACPVIQGNSGGPILQQDAGGTWQVVGVISAQSGGTAVVVALPPWLRREMAAHLGK